MIKCNIVVLALFIHEVKKNIFRKMMRAIILTGGKVGSTQLAFIMLILHRTNYVDNINIDIYNLFEKEYTLKKQD